MRVNVAQQNKSTSSNSGIHVKMFYTKYYKLLIAKTLNKQA